MKRSQSSKRLHAWFQTFATGSRLPLLKAGSWLLVTSSLLVLAIVFLLNSQGKLSNNEAENYSSASAKGTAAQSTTADKQLLWPAIQEAPAHHLAMHQPSPEIDSTEPSIQSLHRALEEVPVSLRSWAALQEKSLRTAEEQAVFENETLEKLDEALAFLKAKKISVREKEQVAYFRNEAHRVWHVTLVAEALKNASLNAAQLRAIDDYLIECPWALANESELESKIKRAENQESSEVEFLLDCVAVAHAYVRARPAAWDDLNKQAPASFGSIARVANLYREIQ